MANEAEEIGRLILEAKRQAYEEIGDVPPPQKPVIEWPIQCSIEPGLAGAVAAESRIGVVDGARGRLIYAGYDIFDLAAYSTFEEVVFLLFQGNLPTPRELTEFRATLKRYYRLIPTTYELIRALPYDSLHPMTLLEVAMAGAQADDAISDGDGENFDQDAMLRLVAQMMISTGMIQRIRHNQAPIAPDPCLSHAGNLLYCLTGEKPTPLAERVMDISLILHADHGMNASTFTSMVVTSTMSDVYAAVRAGIGSLKGPLHGGANEAALHDLEEIGSEEFVAEWYAKARSQKRKIMGMGHREYKAYDPRARVLKPIARFFAERTPEIAPIFRTAEALEKLHLDTIGRDKRLFPNVDFYSGIVYRGMHIDRVMFTPIFAVSRVAGWLARSAEYRRTNRIFRPGEYYIGEIDREYIPLAKREDKKVHAGSYGEGDYS
jgi:citrate synthase